MIAPVLIRCRSLRRDIISATIGCSLMCIGPGTDKTVAARGGMLHVELRLPGSSSKDQHQSSPLDFSKFAPVFASKAKKKAIPNPHPPPRHRVILLHPSNKLNRANSGGRACRLLERKRKRNRKKKKKRRSSHQLPLARHAAKLESKCLNGQINLPIRGSLSAVTGDA
ncbi:uncharacterized protein BKA78DRAFT_76026 [Phyllosticta capitalensis]|uniref:uncharacterized protein n=1 Tax=Phyllosticta capitalensis TaxID=121624 RepID=UPI00312D6868